MEYITANGTVYMCQIETQSDTVILKFNKKIEKMKEVFEKITAFTVSEKDGEVYGEYKNLKFQSITEQEDGAVEIKMRILGKMEIAINELQKTQDEQDRAI